jgi:hypothetical protein
LEHKGVTTFSDVARATMGVAGQWAVESFLVISQIGGLLGFEGFRA